MTGRQLLGLLFSFFTAVIPLALIPAQSSAWNSCIDYAEYLHWVSSIDSNLDGWDVVSDGTFAYVAADQSGLRVYNISDPYNPTSIDSYNSPGNARGVCQSGSTVFLADGNYGLQIIDVSNPSSVYNIGNIDTPGNAYGVDVVGSFAYIADAYSGLHVVDVSLPSVPQIVGTANTPGTAQSVVVEGSYCFIADGSTGLQIIDVADPYNPVIISALPTLSTAYSIDSAGDFVYVGSSTGIQAFDVSDPYAPLLVGSLATPSTLYDVRLEGSIAYCAAYAQGVLTIDVSNPAYPVVIGSLDSKHHVRGIFVIGDHAYAAEYDGGLQILNISNPASPLIVGADPAWGEAWEVAVRGNYAYVADHQGGLWIYDITNPALPTHVSSVGTPGYATNATVSGDYVYVAEEAGGMQIVDVSDVVSPVIVGSISLYGHSYAIEIMGGYAYVAGGATLSIIDITDPSDPIVVGSLSVGNSRGVDVKGDYAYVVYGHNLSVIGISSPGSPVLMGTVDTLDDARDIVVSGKYAYVADSAGGLQVIDVSVPDYPILVGSLDAINYAYAVEIVGDYIYLADASCGMKVINISNPAAPYIVGSINTPGTARGIDAMGDYIFIADEEEGLQIIQSQCPSLVELHINVAVGTGLNDWDNLAATHGDATDGYDIGLEMPEPPPIPANYCIAHFPHPEWGSPLGERFKQDIREPYDLDSASKTWLFRIETDQSDTVSIYFDPNFGEGAGWGPWVHDLTTGETFSLYPNLFYRYTATGVPGLPDVRDLEITIGGAGGIPTLDPPERWMPPGWSMVGAPLQSPPGQNSFGEVLLDDANGPIYMYAFTEAQNYESRQSHDDMPQGEGYWVGAIDSFTWTMEGAPNIAGALVPINNGWTMIGNPILHGADLSGVVVDHIGTQYTYGEALGLGLVSGSLFDYDQDTESYIPVSHLEAWHGYWISGYEDGLSLWFHYQNMPPTLKKDRDGIFPGADWQVDIALNRGSTAASFGAGADATLGFDAALDLPIPPASPAGSQGPVMYFPHPEWGLNAGSAFISDFMASGSGDMTWSALLASPVPGTVELSWNLQEVPGHIDFQIYLPEKDQIVVASMASQSQTTLVVEDYPVSIQFIATQELSDSPQICMTEYMLMAHPNPFNPSTTIEYQLPTRGLVRLGIYNLRGRLVGDLVQEIKNAGGHNVEWDGRDQAGAPVASGVYFARMEFKGQITTQKLVVAR